MSKSIMVVFHLRYLHGCYMKCTYIPVQFNEKQNLFPCKKKKKKKC